MRSQSGGLSRRPRHSSGSIEAASGGVAGGGATSGDVTSGKAASGGVTGGDFSRPGLTRRYGGDFDVGPGTHCPPHHPIRFLEL